VRLGLLWKGAAVAGLVAVVAAAGGIAWINHTRPKPLGLAQSSVRSPAPSPSPDDPLIQACRRPAVPAGSPAPGVDGLWVIQPGSIAGYRAHEQFAELTSPHEAVARTDRMSGWLLVAGGNSPRLETGCFAVDVRTLRSVDELPGFNTSDRDRSARDFLGAFEHPFAVFQPYPASLALDPSSTAVQHVVISGDLEVSGVTKPAKFSLNARLQDDQVSIAGNTTVQVEDIGVQLPEAGNGFVQVDPHITLEVSLSLLRP